MATPPAPTESPYLTTREAAEYLRYKASSAIRVLKMRGLLVPAGRRGATDLYRREDLDAFVTGSVSGVRMYRPPEPERQAPARSVDPKDRYGFRAIVENARAAARQKRTRPKLRRPGR